MNQTLTPATMRRMILGCGMFILVAAAIALTARDPGLTWDESIYLGRAVRYLDWFRTLSAASFTDQAVMSHWAFADHPPLGCVWIAFNLGTFGGFMNIISAARMGAAILFGVIVVVLFLWAATRRNALTGLVAAGAFVLMPRIFADGHFANLEMMTLLTWMLTIIAFKRGIHSRTWSILCGVFFGLALLTKINGVFLPVVLLPWGFMFHGRKTWRNVISMALIGPLVFFAGWPVLWRHPVDGIRVYLANKMYRSLTPVYYLGIAYKDRVAPWHYPFIMLLATTPLPVLAGAAGGVWSCVRRLRERWRTADHEVLVVWAFVFPVLLLAMPGVPKYDGVRLMLPAYPFLAVLAAYGAAAGWDWLRKRTKSARPIAWACGVLLTAWLVAPVVIFHPYQLAYYGELVGGPGGANKLGFETTYWGETFDYKALNYLNENVPANGSVAFVAVGDFVWTYHQEILKEARPDIQMGEFEKNDWDYLVVIPRQGWWNKAEQEYVAGHTPVWTNPIPLSGGLPGCMIYKR